MATNLSSTPIQASPSRPCIGRMHCQSSRPSQKRQAVKPTTHASWIFTIPAKKGWPGTAMQRKTSRKMEPSLHWVLAQKGSLPSSTKRLQPLWMYCLNMVAYWSWRMKPRPIGYTDCHLPRKLLLPGSTLLSGRLWIDLLMRNQLMLLFLICLDVYQQTIFVSRHNPSGKYIF